MSCSLASGPPSFSRVFGRSSTEVALVFRDYRSQIVPKFRWRSCEFQTAEHVDEPRVLSQRIKQRKYLHELHDVRALAICLIESVKRAIVIAETDKGMEIRGR